MSEYLVLQQADGVYRQVAHPGYLDENGDLAAHNLLADRGYYLAQDERPVVDTRYQRAVRQPTSEWEYDHDKKICVVTYTVEEKANAVDLYLLEKRRQVDYWVRQTLRKGVEVEIDGAKHCIQTRHERDQINLLSVHSKATSRVTRDDTTPCKLITEDNVALELEPASMVTILEQVFDAQEAIYQKGWDVKAQLDAIDTSGDVVEVLEAIDNVDLPTAE